MKKIIYIIMFLIFILLTTSCTQRLDLRIKDMMEEYCECDVNSCSCTDEYTDNYLFIDCNNTEVDIIFDLVDCKSGYKIGDETWSD